MVRTGPGLIEQGIERGPDLGGQGPRAVSVGPRATGRQGGGVGKAWGTRHGPGCFPTPALGSAATCHISGWPAGMSCLPAASVAPTTASTGRARWRRERIGGVARRTHPLSLRAVRGGAVAGRRAAALDPAKAAVWLLCGDCQQALGFAAEAGVSFRQALDLQPDCRAAADRLAGIRSGTCRGADRMVAPPLRFVIPFRRPIQRDSCRSIRC